MRLNLKYITFDFLKVFINNLMQKKVIYTLVLTFVFVFRVNAQSTWFKFVPGWQCNNTIVQKDTIFSFCPTSMEVDSMLAVGFNLNKVSIKTGEIYQSDSLFYFSKKINAITNLEYRSKFNALELGADHFLIGANFGDSTNTTINWQSDIFEYPGYKKLNYQLNIDTFRTDFCGLFDIHKIKYVNTQWVKMYSRVSSVTSSRVMKLNSDGTSKVFYTTNNTERNTIIVDEIIEDKKSSNYMFLNTTMGWDYHGVPACFEALIVKVDSSGKTIWKSRPIGDQDSISSSGFQMVQLPNGNILCSWLDLYYRPYKNSKSPLNYIETGNDNSTIWFAEIDNTTGKKLWTKNIQQYLTWKMSTSDIPGVLTINDIIFTHSQITTSNNSIIWCGYRSNWYGILQSWKYLPVILKTDLQGNPIWYREYNLFPDDSGDKGFSVVSFAETPDHGILLSGQYVNYFGQMTNGEAWQKAALLKLDSNGCFTPGCNAYDRVIKIVAPKQLCTVFPSPANNLIDINYPEKSRENWKVEIIDITGKLLFQSDENPTRIASSQFPDGNYFINFTNSKTNHYETHQIIIQH